MSENTKKIIGQIYKAFNERDYATVLTFFATDFEWYAADSSPLADQSPYHGINSVRTGVFDRIAAAFEKLEVLPDELFAADAERVVALGYYHGKFRGKPDEFRTQAAHIWTLRDGKAIKFQQYVDTLKISTDAAA